LNALHLTPIKISYDPVHLLRKNYINTGTSTVWGK